MKFCESARELNETVEGYKGWISKGWIQEEQIHIDVLPCELSLSRRYAFRYLRVEVLAVSMKFRLSMEDAWVDSATSADDQALAPFSGGLVPAYMMWTQTFHIKNTLWALIIPGLLMNGFYIIMMRSFFTANIPDALIEAARIDGCNEYRILFRIVVPLSLPMMVTLILMMGLGYWNDWMNSLYYVTDEKLFSIQAILNTIITNIQFITSGQGSLASNKDMSKLPSVGVRMAIAIVGIIPVLIIYPFFQKYFVRGIVVVGVKG